MEFWSKGRGEIVFLETNLLPNQIDSSIKVFTKAQDTCVIVVYKTLNSSVSYWLVELRQTMRQPPYTEQNRANNQLATENAEMMRLPMSHVRILHVHVCVCVLRKQLLRVKYATRWACVMKAAAVVATPRKIQRCSENSTLKPKYLHLQVSSNLFLRLCFYSKNCRETMQAAYVEYVGMQKIAQILLNDLQFTVFRNYILRTII